MVLMKSKFEREQITKAKTKYIDKFRISPIWFSRMNKKTLGQETGSGKQGECSFLVEMGRILGK